MQFSGQYLTYAEYSALGGTLKENPSFNLLEFEARKIIDLNTSNRLKECTELPQEVKLCEFELINSLESYSSSLVGSTQNKNIASEHTDGYTISYVSGDQISGLVKSKNAELEDIVRTYLLNVVVDGVHIMYRGVS